MERRTVTALVFAVCEFGLPRTLLAAPTASPDLPTDSMLVLRFS